MPCELLRRGRSLLYPSGRDPPPIGGREIPSVFGNTTGLKSSQTARLERLYRRKVPPSELVTPELARALTEISREITRQVGLLIDRGGTVRAVVVGTDR